MKSKVMIGIDKSKSYRVHLTITTDIVEESRKLHMLTPLAAAGLGRVLTAIGMMSLDLKGEKNSISLLFQGDGPAKQILATAHGEGSIKGYISNPDVDLPLKANGKLDVGGSIGAGQLFVTKDLGLKEPYVGAIKLVSGEIAEDLTNYFFSSEQKATSVSLGVKIGINKNIIAAGGMIIEVLPNAKEESIVALEKLVEEMKPITAYVEEALLMRGNKSDEQVLDILKNLIFANVPKEYEPEVLGIKEIELKCDCNRKRIEEAFMTIGKDEIEAILEEDGKAEMSCHFCNKKYYFDAEDLQALISSI